MSGLPKYFIDTPYQVIDGNIAYASNLNNPFAAIALGIQTLSVDVQTGGSKYALDTGAVNAYVVSLDPAPTEYVEGLEVWLKTAASNTGASTINVNSLGVVDIRRHGLDPLLAGDIPANYFTLLKYSNGFFQIVSASGRGEAEASAEIAEAQAIIATEQAIIATEQAGLAEDAKDDAIAALQEAHFPTIDATESMKFSRVNSSGDGYDLLLREELEPVPSGVMLIGGISGFNYSRTGSHTISVDPGGCADSTNSTWISISSQQSVTIPSVANEIYSLFVCSDGVVRTDTDVHGANLSLCKIRWIGFVKNNAYGVLAGFTQFHDAFTFLNYSEATAMTGIKQTPISTFDVSSVVPVERISDVTVGGQGWPGTPSLALYGKSGGVASIGLIGLNVSANDNVTPWGGVRYTVTHPLRAIVSVAMVSDNSYTGSLGVQSCRMVR